MSHGSTQRLIQMLTEVDPPSIEKLFMRHGIDPRYGVKRLVDEILEDGSNSLLSLIGFEKKGYAEIVQDVADNLGVPLDDVDKENEEQIEHAILAILAARYLAENATAPKIVSTIKEKIGVSPLGGKAIKLLLAKSKKDQALAFKDMDPQEMLQVLGSILPDQGSKVEGRIFDAIAASTVAGVAFFPVIAAGLLAVRTTGPAYRKTVPSIIAIAFLRLKILADGKRLRSNNSS